MLYYVPMQRDTIRALRNRLTELARATHTFRAVSHHPPQLPATHTARPLTSQVMEPLRLPRRDAADIHIPVGLDTTHPDLPLNRHPHRTAMALRNLPFHRFRLLLLLPWTRTLEPLIAWFPCLKGFLSCLYSQGYDFSDIRLTSVDSYTSEPMKRHVIKLVKYGGTGREDDGPATNDHLVFPGALPVHFGRRHWKVSLILVL